MDGLLTRPPHRLTSFDVFHYIPVMGYVGADPGDLQHLSRRCHEAAEDLEHRRRRVGAELRAVGMESPIEHQLARVEAWLRDQERSLHHRAGEAEAAAGGDSHHGWGMLGHAASSFAHGVWDGTTGIVKGAVGLGQLQIHGLEEPFRLAHALWDDGASGVADEVRTELERDEQMVKGLYAEALHLGELANRFGPAGPLYFAWDVHRHGLDETLSSYAYDAGTLVPDAVITIATMGGGEVVAADAEVAEADATFVSRAKVTDAFAQSQRQGQWLREDLARREAMGSGGRIAGPGTATPFRDAPLHAKAFGGRPEDWVKMSSGRFEGPAREVLQVHWIENVITGERRLLKLKHWGWSRAR
jgi:hypothetical protein